MSKRNMKWETLGSVYLIKRPWLTARRDTVKLPNGTVHDEYYVLEYPDWINVIAETKDGKIIIERQYRHGLGIESYEIYAGVMENGEKPLQAAKRELQEETGHAGGEWQEIMTLSPNSGAMTNMCHCFVAKGVEKISDQHLDNTEDIDVYLFNKEKVFNMLNHREFKQALMVAPLLKYFSTTDITKELVTSLK